jgi:hypothetical protein
MVCSTNTEELDIPSNVDEFGRRCNSVAVF